MPNTSLPPMRPNAVGLPGFTAMPWKSTSPLAAMTSRIRSRSPTELPPENTSTSSREALVDRARQVVDRVGGRAMKHRHAAVLGDDRREREAVDVVDLARAPAAVPGSTISLPVERIATRGRA